MVLCVVVFSLQSNCFVTVLHVVSHCCLGYCNACQFLCLLSLLLLVPSFVNLGMALRSSVSLLLHMLLLETRLSISFQNVTVAGLNICIWCCWCCCRHRLFVVVTVDGALLTFVGDEHGVSPVSYTHLTLPTTPYV